VTYALVASGVYVMLTTITGALLAQLVAAGGALLLFKVRINPLILIAAGSLIFIGAHHWQLV